MARGNDELFGPSIVETPALQLSRGCAGRELGVTPIPAFCGFSGSCFSSGSSLRLAGALRGPFKK